MLVFFRNEFFPAKRFCRGFSRGTEPRRDRLPVCLRTPGSSEEGNQQAGVLFVVPRQDCNGRYNRRVGAQHSTEGHLAADLSHPDDLETTLLLACARNRLDSETIKQIKTIVEEGEVDWTLVVRRAIAHGLTPLLARNLARACSDSLPVELVEPLRAWLAQNRARGLTLAHEVLIMVDLLEARNIPAIPIKGPVLAETLFGDLALRQCGDLDLLVPKQCVSSALDVFRSRGYQLRHSLGAGQDAACRRYDNQFELERPDQMISAELHWNLIPRMMAVSFDVGGLWQRALAVPFEGRSVPSLSCEDYLIFLCVHGSKHSWCELKWICDIHEFLDVHPAIDWKRCLELSRKQGCERMLLLGLTLAEALLENKLPEPVRDRIHADPKVRQIAGRMRANFFRVGQRDVWSAFRLMLALRERFRDKVLFCWEHVTTPRRYHIRIVPLPRFLLFLYVPIKLFYDYVWWPLRRSFKKAPLEAR